MQPVDGDDTGGQPVFLVAPAENVYSYFMFIGPTEHKRRKARNPELLNETNWDIVMGYILVGLNVFMQTVLLYLIFEEIIVGNVEWQNGIIKLSKGGGPGLLGGKPEGCNDGGSLCFMEEGQYSCAPPSVQLTGRWSELDTDGDGIWTRDEVIAKQEELKCKYVVDPVVVFDVLLSMLREREKLLWLHPKILDGSAIHLPYFTYIMADVIMCGYRSEDMCSNLLQRGYFHAPLKYGTAPRVGTTIDSALRYCKNLLSPGGMCERNLPSTYAVWKTSSTVECGSPTYETFKYEHPASGAKKSLLAVDYASRQEYELAQDWKFQAFKGIVIFLWLLLISCDFRRIIMFLTVCGRLPNANLLGEDAVIMEQDPSDPEDVRFRIEGLETHHRWSMIALMAIRFVLACILLVVGVSYLIKTNAYADILMNGVSLGFIAEISEVLFALALREEVKDQTEDIKAIKVEMYGIDWLNRRPALIDTMVVIALVIATYFVMQWQLTSIVVPIHGSLQCACLSDGDTCVEAQKYNYDFWHEYWLNGVPGVFEAVKALKAESVAAGAPATVASFLEVAAGENVQAALHKGRKALQRQLEALANRFQLFERREASIGAHGPLGDLVAQTRGLLSSTERIMEGGRLRAAGSH